MDGEHPAQLCDRRRGSNSPATWYSLPESVAANILARVAMLSYQEVANIRLVSTSWRDSLWACPGCLGICNEGEAHPQQLPTLCKILSGATSIVLFSYEPIILEPVGKLMHLRDVHLAFEHHVGSGGDMNPPVDLSVLPPTVTKLVLDNIGLDMTSIERVRFTLKLLEVTIWDGGLPQTLALISGQPKLEDLSLIGMALIADEEISLYMEDAFHSHLASLSSLTRLRLCAAELYDFPPAPKFPPNLRELHLDRVRFHVTWVRELLECMTSLTLLDMRKVPVSGGELPPGLQPLDTLRTLNSNTCDDIMLAAAGPKLENLSLNGGWWGKDSEELPASEIGRLNALTKLEIRHYLATNQTDLRPLHGLRLKELSLLDCTNMEAGLFKAGAFPALEVLHIEESEPSPGDTVRLPSSEVASELQLEEAGKVVLSLPKLRQLSGNSKALHAWMQWARQADSLVWTETTSIPPMKMKSYPRASLIYTYTKVQHG